MQDPQFVDAGTFDFRLAPQSPAVDTGLALSEVADDLLGVERPQGNGYDLGAYERTSDAGYRIFAIGCGCKSEGGPWAWPLAALGWVGLARARRKKPRATDGLTEK